MSLFIKSLKTSLLKLLIVIINQMPLNGISPEQLKIIQLYKKVIKLYQLIIDQFHYYVALKKASCTGSQKLFLISE